MLFDLRGRGRRRTVQTIYLGLALLMAFGLIGFGVGTGFGGGGIFEALNSKEGGGGNFTGQVEKAQNRVQKHRSDPAAWVALTEAQMKEASTPEYYVSETGTYTSKGKEELRHIANSWEQYLQLNPSNPNPRLARRVAVIFGEGALNEPAKAVQALQILAAAEPNNAHVYGSLASSAYLAKNLRTGDLAAKRALALSPPSKRPLEKLTFEKQRKQASEKSSGTGVGSSGNVTVTPSSGSSGSSGSAKK